MELATNHEEAQMLPQTESNGSSSHRGPTAVEMQISTSGHLQYCTRDTPLTTDAMYLNSGRKQLKWAHVEAAHWL